MKRSELLRLFNKNNIILLEHGKRHDIYYKPDNREENPRSATRKRDCGRNAEEYQEGRRT